MVSLQNLLQARSSHILVLDGGVSTLLEDRAAFRYRELWSSSLLLDEAGRQVIRQGHGQWIDAGVDILSTVTYQCHYQESLWPPGDVIDRARMDQMWFDAVALARQAIRNDSRVHVAASSGCYGAALANGAEYTGDYGLATELEVADFHRCKLERMRTLDVDAVAIETVPSLLECQALAQVLAESNTLSESTACWISFACRNVSQLNDGTDLRRALEVLRPIPTSRLTAIGLNCCDSVHLESLMTLVVEDMLENGPVRAVVVYPNSGEEWDAAQATWSPGTGLTAAEELSNRLLKVIKQVERLWSRRFALDQYPTMVVGGCCRTRPPAIAALRKQVDEHIKARSAIS